MSTLTTSGDSVTGSALDKHNDMKSIASTFVKNRVSF